MHRRNQRIDSRSTNETSCAEIQAVISSSSLASDGKIAHSSGASSFSMVT